MPPSSIDDGSTRAAVCASSSFPTAVEPVNDSVATRWSARTARDTSTARVVVTTSTTPSGTPARRRTSATHSAVSGVSGAGLSTAVQPAASAGASLRVAMAAGKFHGVTRYATPSGRWSTTIVLSPLGEVRKSPVTRQACSENQRKNSAAYATSPTASAQALPFSCAMSRAPCSASAVMRSNARRRTSARSRGGVRDHGPKAACAAATAVSACSRPRSGTRARTSSVAGSTTSNQAAGVAAGVTASPCRRRS